MNARSWPQKLAFNYAEAEVASGMCRRTLEGAIKSGRLKSSLVGGRRQIFRDDLEEFLRGGPAKSWVATCITEDASELPAFARRPARA